MTDIDLKQAVLDELHWAPGVNAAHIAVTAEDGVVTLNGHVGSYIEMLAAEHATRRVHGVKAIAMELEVRSLFDHKVDDADIARRALQVLSWDMEVPAEKVKVKVEKGLVVLTGIVEWNYQRMAAEADVRKLKGVTGVVNAIDIKPSVSASDVRDKILAALKRNAQIDADKIVVMTDGGKVTLSGKVSSWGEDRLVVDTAWSAPGVTEIKDDLVIA